MSLPSGYTRLEYIESTGTQYIDTGIKGTSTMRVKVEFMVLGFGSGTTFVFGSQTPETARYTLGFTSDGIFRSDFGSHMLSGDAAQLNTWYDADKNGNVCTIGSSKITNNSATFIGTSNIYLFARSYTSLSYSKIRMRSCKIYNGSTLVRDFIPCKNASGIVGLWDDVNSAFYTNSGSGSFVAGEIPIGTHKALVNGTEYEVTSGSCLVAGTKYDIKKGRTLINGTGFDITFAPSYDPVFANNTWEQIIAACRNNEVPDTWKVADHKPMTINGVDYQIDIIGKNHDTYSDGSGKAPLTFQLHDCYGELKNMNSKNTNKGGWTSCAMRSTHLPAILALMPTKVQNGIREVKKLTSEGILNATTINATADKLFLLSEIEIFGKVTHSKSGEGTQYDYYKAGNSKVKKYNGLANSWLERSLRSKNKENFCVVGGNGNASYGYASYEYGVAFAFCF